MTLILLFLVLVVLVLVGVASALGRTPDSRDPDFSVGALLGDRGAGRER